jgi:hypothetical protein
LAEKEKPAGTQQDAAEHALRRMDMLERRLDDIDSTVGAVVERVMKQPMNITVTCPHCGKNIQISLLGSTKPTI